MEFPIEDRERGVAELRDLHVSPRLQKYLQSRSPKRIERSNREASGEMDYPGRDAAPVREWIALTESQDEGSGQWPHNPRSQYRKEQARPGMLHADRPHAGDDLGGLHQREAEPEQYEPSPGVRRPG